MTRRLTVYLVARYLGLVGVVLGVLVMLITTLTLVDATKNMLHRGASWQAVGLLVLTTALEYAYRFYFVGVGLGFVLAARHWAQTGELAGLMLLGLSPARLMAPLLAVTVCCALLLTGMGDRTLPWAHAQRIAVLRERLDKIEPATLYFMRRSTWFELHDWVLHLPEVDAQNTGFCRVTLYALRGGHLHSVLRAGAMRYANNGVWCLHAVREQRLEASAPTLEPMRCLTLGPSPDALIDHVGHPKTLSLCQNLTLMARRKQVGLDTTLYAIEALERATTPWCAPLLMLASAPWLLDPNRRRALGPQVLGMVAVMAYVLAGGQLLRLLALAHRVPAALGATGPLVCAASTWGLSVLLRRVSGAR